MVWSVFCHHLLVISLLTSPRYIVAVGYADIRHRSLLISRYALTKHTCAMEARLVFLVLALWVAVACSQKGNTCFTVVVMETLRNVLK